MLQFLLLASFGMLRNPCRQFMDLQLLLQARQLYLLGLVSSIFQPLVAYNDSSGLDFRPLLGIRTGQLLVGHLVYPLCSRRQQLLAQAMAPASWPGTNSRISLRFAFFGSCSHFDLQVQHSEVEEV